MGAEILKTKTKQKKKKKEREISSFYGKAN